MRGLLISAVLLGSVAVPPMMAYAAPLVPMTRIKLTVVQFVASSGEYKRWDALGGEFDVSADGTIAIPTLGAIDVGKLTPDLLASDIAKRLQDKLGLLDTPDASVQVLRYPPIYVVGNVSTPGEFDYRPGMSVVHAIALAGGQQRAEGVTGTTDAIKLETDLAGFQSDILRITARLARIGAEYNGEDEIVFPVELDPLDPRTAQILDQERRIFTAHGNELARQKTGLVDLAALYNAEIDALNQKMSAVDEQISRAEVQATSIKALVASGSATASRLSDAERILADLRSERLDIVISTMTARENLNRSQRDLAKLEDEQQSDTASLLQQEQANLEKVLQQQGSARRLLVQVLDLENSTVLAQQAQTTISYSILRQENGNTVTLPATEVSVLEPGDLVKVALVETPPAGQAKTSDLASVQ